MRTVRIGAVAAGAWMALAGAACAGPERLPLSGGPAVTLDVPDGWTVARSGQAAYNLTNAQHTGVISVTVEMTPPDFDIATFRDNLFKAATCGPLGRSERLRIGGRAAQAWYCQYEGSDAELAPARVALIRLDSTHILAITHAYRLNASGADVQALERVIDSARYEAAP